MDKLILPIWTLLGFPDGGGDKAPVAGKAEAKAQRYALFFKNVDDFACRAASCLTGFGQVELGDGSRCR
jgi:hypothetical protein